MKKRMFLLMLLVLLVGFSGNARAAVYTVYNALITEGTNTQHTNVNAYDDGSVAYGIGTIWGNWSDNPAKYHEVYTKYLIPTLAAGEVIQSVMINVDVLQLYGSAPGCIANYISNDSWNVNGVGGPVVSPFGNAAFDYTAGHPSIVVADPGTATVGLHTADITSFVQVAGEGSGQMLTVNLVAYGGGIRGALAGYDTNLWPNDPPGAWLTVKTVIPDYPIRSRVDFGDFAVIAEDWLQCTNGCTP